ncbi:MAG: DUF1292 domain-containing protein [Clostridiales bacterium]|nr:DUF1292 domain-containing protein [Clostridiales bacterium]
MHNNPEMNEEDVEDVVVMTDDEGNEFLYDIAARIEKNDQEYVVLVPQDEEDDEVVILKSILVDDETEELVPEEDEDITDAVFEEFKELFADEFNFTDGEDDDALFTDAE